MIVSWVGMLPYNWRRRVRALRVSARVAHVCGPKRIHVSATEAAVTCVVRNGDFYIKEFIKHYCDMGFRHILFLDNGSADNTVSIASRYKNVTVYKSELPVDGNQALFKKYLAGKVIGDGWCLDADIDEFFDYPSSRVLHLPGFLEYLNRCGYSAVTVNLLDMFSEEPLLNLTKTHNDSLKATYCYYDISGIIKKDYKTSPLAVKYGSKNRVPKEVAMLYWGGIRDALWGNKCLLTKHSLFRRSEPLDLFPHVHFVNNARIADVSGIMRHYKLTGNAQEIAKQNRERFIANKKGYADCLAFLEASAGTSFKRESAAVFFDIEELVDRGFAMESETYRQHVSCAAALVDSCPAMP